MFKVEGLKNAYFFLYLRLNQLKPQKEFLESPEKIIEKRMKKKYLLRLMEDRKKKEILCSVFKDV